MAGGDDGVRSSPKDEEVEAIVGTAGVGKRKEKSEETAEETDGGGADVVPEIG